MSFRISLFMAPLLLLTACGGKSPRSQEVPCVYVAEAVGADGDNSVVSFPGRTVASEEVNVSFRVSGPLVRMAVKEGDYVRKGQLIAEMDSRDYRLQLAATEAEYNRIQSDARRVTAMYRETTTTEQNYDQARYALQQITQKLENHRNQLADTRLTAPVAGYVKERLHEAGETVSAGMPIVSIAAGDGVEVEINVSARDYSRQDCLDDFRCTIDALDGSSLPLHPVRTGRVANANQLYSVRYAVTGEYDRRAVTPGMSTIVYARVQTADSAVVGIPSAAVFRHEGRSCVYIYSEARHEVRRREVQPLSASPDGSLTVRGVRLGEKVVAAGVRHLEDGQQVKAVPQPSATNVGGMM
ncbi:MAG: efflux RND transporter periplasmic adaptor subunit [Prevotella sp.]